MELEGEVAHSEIKLHDTIRYDRIEESLTAVRLGCPSKLKQNTETVLGLFQQSLAYLFSCWKICKWG